MPAQPIGVWGIDLGQCGLKAIRLQEIDGQIVATAFDYVEHPKILSQPDADPDQLTREALDKFLSRNNLRGDIVAISVPGQSGLARFVKLPPVEEKKIADIVRFEAKQQIPFNLDEVVWDYQKIGSGVVTDGFAMETEIGLFAMKRDMVSRYLQHFKDVNVDVHLVQMAPLALCNYVAFDLLGKDVETGGESGGDKRCVVALDIGADSSNLVITDGERIIWQRPIPLGGNHFTRALTKDLKLTFAKAEHLKRNATKSPDLKKILAALKPVLNDFVGEVQRSLGYFTNTHRDAHIEYMMGLGNAFRLPGLQKFLSEKLQLEVKKLTKMERIDGDQVVSQQAFTENLLTFAVAYGLALQGLKRARLLTNLLPNEIRVERLVKAKKPFAVAAAAALLFAGAGLALSYGLEYRTYGNKRVRDAVTLANDTKKKADQAALAFKQAKDKAREEENAVRTIVAGQFERDNWAELYKFISAAIPQPDGSKREFKVIAEDGSLAETITMDDIPKEFQDQYWNQKAKDAYFAYRTQRLASEAGGDESNSNKGPSAGAEDLIQFNIESVRALFCDNLSTYWDQVKNSDRVKRNPDWVKPPDQLKKNPEGPGWVIELQGWTYHKDRENFVKNTLLENLARLGIRDQKPDAAAAGGTTPTTASSGGGAEQKEPLGPVINRISHVVLYRVDTTSSGDAPFELLGEGAHGDVRNMVFGGAGGSTGAMSPKMMGAGGAGGPDTMSGGTGDSKPAPTGPSRSSWAPLGESAGTGRSGAMGMMGGAGGGAGAGAGAGTAKPVTGPKAGGRGSSGMGAAMMARGGGSGSTPMMPRMMQGGGPPGSTNQPTAPTQKEGANGPKRTEFVILFIWKEPTDSDALRGLSAGDQGGAAAPAAPLGAPPRSLRPKSKASLKDQKKDEAK
jgi:type IV pilus assembly protein PilM